MQNRVSDMRNGKPDRLHEAVVDHEFVLSFTGIETRRFFINLGGIEQMRKTKTGMIVLKSTNPDRSECRETRFVPIRP